MWQYNKTQNNEVVFKGKGGDKPNWIIRKLAEWYGKPLLESPSVAKVTSYLTKLPYNQFIIIPFIMKVNIYFIVPIEISNEEPSLTQLNKPKRILRKFVVKNVVVISRHSWILNIV